MDGVNYALRALIERGFVKVGNFRKSGSKLSYVYALTLKGVSENAVLTAALLRRSLKEYKLLGREIEVLQVELESNSVSERGKT